MHCRAKFNSYEVQLWLGYTCKLRSISIDEYTGCVFDPVA